MSDLTRIIALLYKMTDEDQQRLTTDLINIRVVMWQTALESEARRYGERIDANPPSGEDYAELRRMSERDAQSIVNTYNREVERQVERLFKENPRGNRHYYASNMEKWAARRTRYKQAQIALNTDVSTTELARRRFYEESFNASRYIFTGPAPTCRDCSRRFGAGVVEKAYTEKYPTPRHISCPHSWTPVNPSRKRTDGRLWRG